MVGHLPLEQGILGSNPSPATTVFDILEKMKQQVLIIRGGTTFDNYENYLFYLKNREINLDRLKIRKSWKNRIDVDLGENFEIFLPEMPNGMNARYEEWKMWFERILNFLNNDLILIGSSLGGIFLAKYLSENNISKKLKAVILVSAPFDDIINGKSLADFKLPNLLSNFSKQCNNIYLIQSEDDTDVPFEQVNKYKKALPNAKLIIFEDRGHFSQENFPEIVDLIKEI